MFINVSDELKKAKAGGYAIGAFNTNNLEVTKAICKVAKTLDSPIIIQTTPSAIEYAGLQQIFDIVRNEIEETGVKAAIHLDHGKTFEDARDAIEAGYRSVMIDGSKLTFAENVALTRKVVEFAHPKNVSVEAEIGVMATGEGGSIEGRGEMSTPEDTAKFIELTGVDSIAISIGNCHGAPAGEKIDLSLLEEIAKNIKIPLVMHGSSGLADDDIEAAIKMGVAKFNNDTNIRRAFIEGVHEAPKDAKDYRDIMKTGMEKVEEIVEKRIELFLGN